MTRLHCEEKFAHVFDPTKSATRSATGREFHRHVAKFGWPPYFIFNGPLV
jgi:hypothetical protein